MCVSIAENKDKPFSNNSLPCHRSASFNRSFAIELGLLIYMHCCAMVMRDLNIRSIQCTVNCNVSPLCTLIDVVDVVISIIVVVVNAMYFVLQLLLFDAHCFGTRE